MSGNRLIAAPLLAMMVLAGCGPLEHGNGNKVREDREVSAFSRVENRGSLDVVFREGPEPTAVVEIDENLQPFVKVTAGGGRLLIDVEGGINYRGVGRVEVTSPDFVGALQDGSGKIAIEGITRAQDLDLAVQGSGDLTYCGPMTSLAAHLDGSGELILCNSGSEPVASVNLSVRGSGDLRWSGTAGATEVQLNGTGGVRLEGSTETLKVKLEGSGEVSGKDFTASSAVLELYGSGKVQSTVNGEASALVEGSGQIELWGDVNITRKGDGDADQVIRH